MKQNPGANLKVTQSVAFFFSIISIEKNIYTKMLSINCYEPQILHHINLKCSFGTLTPVWNTGDNITSRMVCHC